MHRYFTACISTGLKTITLHVVATRAVISLIEPTGSKNYSDSHRAKIFDFFSHLQRNSIVTLSCMKVNGHLIVGQW